MPASVILGAQWGDEGKGKITDLLSEQADIVVRYQGGANAGHTVVIGEKTVILSWQQNQRMDLTGRSVLLFMMDPSPLSTESKQ